MSSPWEPAIPQAMQRHGGSHRSVAKSVPAQPAAKEPPDDTFEASRQGGEEPVACEKPERPAAA